MSWISVRNWRKFQHYDPAKRQPPWIKVYNELLDEDAYASLTLRQRGLLHGIWMAYARSRCGLRVARVGLMVGDDTVRIRDIEALNHAGFIEIVASKTLAEGYHDASAHARPRARVETETEEENPPTPNPAVDATTNGHDNVGELIQQTTDALEDIPF
jgi:hypothetical protein